MLEATARVSAGDIVIVGPNDWLVNISEGMRLLVIETNVNNSSNSYAMLPTGEIRYMWLVNQVPGVISISGVPVYSLVRDSHE